MSDAGPLSAPPETATPILAAMSSSAPCAAKGRSVEGRRDALDNAGRIRDPLHVLADHHELVAAPATHGVPRPDGGAKSRRDALEDFVTSREPECPLEVVEVEEDHRHQH